MSDQQSAVTVDLSAKVAIVTGGGGILGRTYCLALGSAGATVVVTDRNGDAATAVADELRTHGIEAAAITADLADDAAIEAMVAEVIARYGGVDILVNNAGLLREQYDLCSELSSDEWRKILAVNVVAPLACARACRASMRERSGGVIINQSSMGAYAALISAYSVSKLALSGLTVALAAEFGDDGIRVNAIAPGMMTGLLPQPLVESVLALQMIHRRGTPDDLVGALLFLCSDAASFITGQTLIVDGGATRRP